MQGERVNQPVPIDQVLEQAAEVLLSKYSREGIFENPPIVKEYLSLKMGHYEREVFALMLLDSQHRLIQFLPLFFGTIDAASVYPREVVKAVLLANAAAVILTHNHPSGVAEPSHADRAITNKLKDALALIDVRVLDHIVVGETSVSFAERGWL
ncbi:DNA repair protein RadC [Shewanella sp. NFH-SH190041]|uniref:RadC family protein n=1 Tax=Shewanella sp. NFH-SH190041 TaxID=2950245 RepID=UPI0021C27623|nr:DNA repair protein RadC [Shewanella sp. NFH-SH190041]BDM66084.1 DNA repair protein RadC [Shewanella sp. NFH-SH190041]